jgi:cell wall-associated NlpC family hydrolase
MMKGRPCIAALFVIIALLFVSAPGYSKTTAHKRARRTSQKTVKESQKYTVRSGDSLGKIAQTFGTTAKAIQSANGMKGNRIKAGQILNIRVSRSAQVKQAKESKPKLPEVLNTLNKVTYMSAAASNPANTEEAVNPESLPTRIRLVQAGFEMLGMRYRFGGSGTNGIDCSGLVKNLFSKFDIDLPRSSKEQYKQGEKISNKDDLQVGDLVFFSSGGTQPTHVGIYIGNNQFIHAARKAKQVVVSDISKLWYTMRYLGARRIAGLWGDEPVTE